MHPSHPSRISDLERSLLQSLCAPQTGPSLIQSVVAQLQDYSWRDEENRIVFRAIARLRGRELEHIRESLPAVTTRMGFPDIDWDAFFLSPSQGISDATSAASALLAARAAAAES